MKEVIERLDPQPLWRHFHALSQIPRCSKQEKKAREYVLGIAGQYGLHWKMDEPGNVVINVPAFAGCEKRPVVVLQSHLDMVCEKNKDTTHDFSTEGLRLTKEGDWIYAEGTTLGADNGIGVAACLAVLESRQLRHGPLELLFTVDEETGLTGAKGLAPDMLQGRLLINMDSEEDGALYIGCAGGRDTVLSLAVESVLAPPNPVVRLCLGGLKGGHSGIEIHQGRANAIRLLARFLWKEVEPLEIRVIRFEGGNKHNAIPRECEAWITVPAARLEALKTAAEQYEKVLKDEYGVTDSGTFLRLELKTGVERETVFSPAFQDRLLNLLFAMPSGVIAMSQAVPELVQTSTNLAIVKMVDSQVQIATSQRSSIPSQLTEIADMVYALGKQAGAHIRQGEGYPGWKPDLNSPLLKTIRAVYGALFGRDPAIRAIHAGLECGLIGSKFPGMDMISFGPTITGAHSPSERVQVSAVSKFWRLLVAVLEKLAI
jgi:dipeptidase D